MISNITAINSTSLKILWGKLLHDHANGNIIKYVLCYQLLGNKNVSCAVNATISKGETTTITLTGLNEASTYDFAMKAATAVGLGKLGATMNGTTLEDSKFEICLQSHCRIFQM